MESNNVTQMEKKSPNLWKIIAFSIINFILLGGFILFMLAKFYGINNWDWGVNLAIGTFSIFFMVGAGIVDVIALIVVLIIRSAQKKKSIGLV